MATIGTKLYRIFFGDKVGEDEFGNRYYRSKSGRYEGVGKPGAERRWVEYRGITEPTKVPPQWHAWLHHMVNEAPTMEDERKRHKWQQDHLPNLTGTELAYRPPGHILKGGKRAKATGDYKAWKGE